MEGVMSIPTGGSPGFQPVPMGQIPVGGQESKGATVSSGKIDTQSAKIQQDMNEVINYLDKLCSGGSGFREQDAINSRLKDLNIEGLQYFASPDTYFFSKPDDAGGFLIGSGNFNVPIDFDKGAEKIYDIHIKADQVQNFIDSVYGKTPATNSPTTASTSTPSPPAAGHGPSSASLSSPLKNPDATHASSGAEAKVKYEAALGGSNIKFIEKLTKGDLTYGEFKNNRAEAQKALNSSSKLGFVLYKSSLSTPDAPKFGLLLNEKLQGGADPTLLDGKQNLEKQIYDKAVFLKSKLAGSDKVYSEFHKFLSESKDVITNIKAGFKDEGLSAGVASSEKFLGMAMGKVVDNLISNFGKLSPEAVKNMTNDDKAVIQKIVDNCDNVNYYSPSNDDVKSLKGICMALKLDQTNLPDID